METQQIQEADMNDLNRIEDIIREVMREDSKTRNSDKWLIIQTLRKMGFKVYVDYLQLGDMPSFETITRCRRKIQNKDGDLLPTERIDNRRTESESKFRGFF